LIDKLLGDRDVEDWQIYVPVVRAKASEWKALAALTPGIRRRIAPIIEFIPEWRGPGSGGGNRKPRAPQTPAEFVRRMVDGSIRSTPSGTRSFVYFGHAGANAQWAGIELWSAFASQAPSGCGTLPLVDLAWIGSAAGLARAVRSAGAGAGLRIGVADLGPMLVGHVAQACRALGASPSEVHLIVDLQSNPAAASHATIRASLGNIRAFGSVVVLAGVFPVDLTQYQPGVQSEPRLEWRTWRREHVGTPPGERPLGFGDYTTQCAHYRPSPAVPGSVSLRYTTEDAILVFRGRQANGGAGLGFEQIHGHCRLLVARPDYSGAVFSAGDQRIHCWTDPTKGPGNPEQWRTACLAHHITQVVVQLQDNAGSSATIRAWARGQVPAACP